MGRPRTPIPERFWPKTRVEGDHVFWTAGCNSHGYGTFYDPDRGNVGAHIVAWEMEHGPVPDGMELDHLCRVRNCVNHRHLEVVTRAENQRRGLNGVLRVAPTVCRHGHVLADVGTYTPPGRRSHECRECRREAVRRADAKRSPRRK